MSHWLTEIKWEEGSVVWLHLTADTDRKVTKVRCGFVELVHVRDFQHPLDLFEIPTPVREHPLLWDFTDCQNKLYIASPPTDAFAAMGQLLIAHKSSVGDWWPVTNWLAHKDSIAQLEFLRIGAGCFATGPQRVLKAYHEVLAAHGCRPSLLRYDALGDRSDEEIRNNSRAQAMVFSPEFFVVAEEFTIHTE